MTKSVLVVEKSNLGDDSKPHSYYIVKASPTQLKEIQAIKAKEEVHLKDQETIIREQASIVQSQRQLIEVLSKNSSLIRSEPLSPKQPTKKENRVIQDHADFTLKTKIRLELVYDSIFTTPVSKESTRLQADSQAKFLLLNFLNETDKRFDHLCLKDEYIESISAIKELLKTLRDVAFSLLDEELKE